LRLQQGAPTVRTEAKHSANGREATAERLATRLIVPRHDNLVERPWGGARIREFKRLDTKSPAGPRIGESFEIAADDSDAEARRHVSLVDLPDGSNVRLASLLEQHSDTLLGEEFVLRYGRRYPLLPKLLDVEELLSVQAHPPGNTEVYVVVAAEPGATIRVGFNRDVDSAALAARLTAGRDEQQRLLQICRRLSPDALQAQIQPWLADRDASAEALAAALSRSSSGRAEVEACLRTLHDVYWEVLDLMNAIPVEAGQVIYNANPPRVTALYDKPASAEVHALGNPEGRSVLALEIRRPGPTFRAWDNVRFPLRDVDTAAALMALNLTKTSAGDFIVERKPVRPGVERSVDSHDFRLEHLAPTALTSIDVPAAGPHTLHVLAGAVGVYAADGELLGRLARGVSALVPIGVGAYRVVADADEPAQLVKVELPPYAA
jgi:hypothetical protein